MARVEFFVPWTVQPKQSFRFTRTGKRYKPADVQTNENALVLLTSQHRPPKPLAGPLRASYAVTYPWLSKHSDKQRAKHGNGIPKATLPDCDNIAKQVSDCLAKAGFYANDSQIWELRVSKRFGDVPGIAIRLEDDGIQ